MSAIPALRFEIIPKWAIIIMYSVMAEVLSVPVRAWWWSSYLARGSVENSSAVAVKSWSVRCHDVTDRRMVFVTEHMEAMRAGLTKPKLGTLMVPNWLYTAMAAS